MTINRKIIAALLFALSCIFLTQAPAAERPNIVYIMADDLGYGDFSAERMPKSYALREDLGTELNFYTMQNCVSSRAALMTGKYPSEFGIVGVNSPPHFNGLPVEEVLFPERLQSAGYRTGIFGKWHLGLTEAQSPLNNGFDEFLGFAHGWINYYGVRENGLAYIDGSMGHDHHAAHDFQINGVPLYNSSYSTYAFSEAAQQFIRSHVNKKKRNEKDKPFFVYVPFNAPHGPYASPRRYVEELMHEYGVDQATFDILQEYEDSVMAIPYDVSIDKETRKRLQTLLYYGSIRALDDAVADIYKTIVESGESDNTLFMFTSDNGASFGARGLPGDNKPFRGGKGSPYEGGHRVPNMVIWPSKLVRDQKVGFNIWIGDLYETFLAAAGVSFNGDDLASNNILPALDAGSDSMIRKHGGQHIINHISKLTNQDRGQDIAFFAMNNAHQKYIRKITINTATGIVDKVEEELYDLNEDPRESNNLVASPIYRFALARMRNKYERWGGDERFVAMPTTLRGGWSGFTTPQEWGFPGRTFDADELLFTEMY